MSVYGPVLGPGHSVQLRGDVNRELGGNNSETEGEDTEDLHVVMMSDTLRSSVLSFINPPITILSHSKCGVSICLSLILPFLL